MPLAKPRAEDQVDYWKTRYLRGLDELEQKERQWTEAEQLLQRAVVRLAAATAEAYPGLGNQLERLRTAGRAGGDSRAVAAVASDLADAALRSPGQDKGGGRPETTLAALLAEIEVPSALAADAATLRRRLEGGGSSSTPDASLKDVARLLRRALAESGPLPPGKPGGGAAPGSATSGEVVRPEQVLLEILLRLDLPDEGGTTAALRERLSRPLPPAELPPLIEAVAEVVASARRGLEEERRGLQSFLSDVSERLAELGENLSRAQADREASQGGRKALSEQVQERFAAMRVSVERARDLDALKQAVRSGLATVEAHVSEHLRVEGQRHQEAEARARATAERLGRLVAETGRLRERLQRARERAVRDPLTGLHNRLAYEERVLQAFAHWKRYLDPLAVLVLDVDRFKLLNDRYGHTAGDKALKAISDGLAQHLREADFIARYGGEEFVVLLPKTDLRAAATVAEKLRRAVEDRQFHYRDHRVAVTVSCGIAEFREGDTPATAFERADRALYRAKQAGRNRCELG